MFWNIELFFSFLLTVEWGNAADESARHGPKD